jgi:hypothetical protein
MSVFIKPKQKPDVPLNMKVSHETIVILKEYSKYTGYEIEELIIKISDKLLEDADFVKYFSNNRDNKKIMSVYKKHLENSSSDSFEMFEDDDF